MRHSHNQTLGKLGEQIAAGYLTHQGYTLIERNWRCQHGELDLIAVKGNAFIIFEVKTRSNNVEQYHPIHAVSQNKLNKLFQLGCIFARKQQVNLRRNRIRAIRFDQIAIVVRKTDHSFRLVELQHLRDICDSLILRRGRLRVDRLNLNRRVEA